MWTNPERYGSSSTLAPPTYLSTPVPTVGEDILNVQANARLAAHLREEPAPHILEEDADYGRIGRWWLHMLARNHYRLSRAAAPTQDEPHTLRINQSSLLTPPAVILMNLMPGTAQGPQKACQNAQKACQQKYVESPKIETCMTSSMLKSWW